MKLENLGRLVATKAVAELEESNKQFAIFLQLCLDKYLNNDWGVLAEEDKEMNDEAAKSGNERILAAYHFPDDASWNAVNSWGSEENKIWIITEWDHSVTTVLFPSEY